MSQDNNKKRSGATSRSRQASARRTQTAARSGFNNILIIVLSVVVVASFIAGFVFKVGQKASPSVTADNSGNEGQVAESNISVVENSNGLELNKYPEVNELIENYRRAFLNNDTELLKKVYNSDQDINVDILKATSEIIESYENSQYYTKRGLNSGEYVVFVYDELKLSGIDTLAPNLSVFYVKPAGDGALYVYRGNYNAATGTYVYEDDVQAYVDSMYQEDDVLKLINEVNTRMDSACANDAELMSFMEKVRNRTSASNVQTPQPTEDQAMETTQDTSTAESETVSETTVETETETVSEEVSDEGSDDGWSDDENSDEGSDDEWSDDENSDEGSDEEWSDDE